MLAINVASASAAVTVSVSNGVMRVVDSSTVPHNIRVDEDGTGRIYARDINNAEVASGSACIAKSIGGQNAISCSRTGVYSVYVTLGGADDLVFYDVNTAPRTDATILTWTGNDGVVGPYQQVANAPFMTINGGLGNDSLTGGGSHDGINGGEGNDTLTGGFGQDNLTGYSGNDTIYAREQQHDVVDCGESPGDADWAQIDNGTLDSVIGPANACETLNRF